MSRENYNKSKENLTNCFKKILKDNLSKVTETLDRYKIELVDKYNEYIYNAELLHEKSIEKEKKIVEQEIIRRHNKAERCINILKINCIKFENLFDKIIIINQTEFEQHLFGFFMDDNKIENKSDDSDSESFDSINSIKMGLTNVKFLKICCSQINKNYTGDTLALESFINSIDLLSTLATSPDLQSFLVTYIKSKLEGKALEALSNDVSNIKELKLQLKTKLKPKVIEGRFVALRMTRNNIQDFAEEAEILADSLKRALISEGTPETKAQETVTEKTVELCKFSAKSDYVRTCLAAKEFSNPKEVIAKLIIETNDDSQHKQVLSFQRINRPSYRGNTYNNFRGNSNRGYNQNRSNSHRGNYYRGNSYRGKNNRGYNYNSNFNNGSSDNRQNSNRGNNRSNFGNNNQNVRYAENTHTPQTANLGEE